MRYEPINVKLYGIDVDAAFAALTVFAGLMLTYATVSSPWTLRGLLAGHGAVVAFLMAAVVINGITKDGLRP